MKTLPALFRSLTFLCAFAALTEAGATSWEGPRPARTRITGTIAIKTSIAPHGSGTEKARNLETLQKLWEERTVPPLSDISQFLLRQVLVETPRTSAGSVKYKRVTVKFEVVTYPDRVAEFSRKIRGLSRIPSTDRREGTIRWKTRIGLSTTRIPADPPE